MDRFERNFPRVDFGPADVPVWCLTPQSGQVIHRFFDTPPLSPSGRYLAVFRLPATDRLGRPGERGEVVLVDTHTGTETVVADTAGWESQMGANINWGVDDRHLVYNDVDTETWTPRGVVLDPLTGKKRFFDHGVYHVSPDGRFAAVGDLAAMRRTQYGYGVMVPDEHVPVHRGPRDDTGVYITDLESGVSRRLLSIREVVERAASEGLRREYAESDVYVFHTKWNGDGSRLMFTLRHFPHRDNAFNRIKEHDLRFAVYTVRPDGSDLHCAIPPALWVHGGHHTTWTPDGDHLTLNVRLADARFEPMRIRRCRYDGSDWCTLGPFVGSGHPSLHRNGRYIMTDCYHNELFTRADGRVPLRLLDLRRGRERHWAYVPIHVPEQARHSGFRVDPHVVWCDGCRLAIFNAVDNGVRRVYAADMRRFLDPEADEG